MQFTEFKAKTKRWNHFSQIDTLGSFDFYTSIISLDAVNPSDLLALSSAFKNVDGSPIEQFDYLTSDQYHQLSKVLPLAIHEYSHFVDATSTLWGLRHLSLMNEAYLSDDRRGTKEGDFLKAKKFYNHVREIRLPSYYTVIDRSNKNLRPWRSTITIGRLFSHDGIPSTKPVLFSRFSNVEGKLLARSPISTVSLLEASAMAQEVISHASLIEKTETNFRLVEQAEFSKKILAHIYNPEITEYSVCVHLIANQLQCTDILAAFRLCAPITRVVLNFPESAFNKILESCPVSDLLHIQKGHDFERVILGGIESRNLGVLFYLLCNALPKGAHESQQKRREGIRAAITAIGVDYETLKADAKAEARKLFANMSSSSIGSISILSKAGYENFERMEVDQVILNPHKLNLPPAFLGDSSQMDIFPSADNLLTKLDLEKCFDELYQGQSWVERFSEACI